MVFSTANAQAARMSGTVSLAMLPNDRMDPVIEATAQATVNALVAAETMAGINGNTVHALPHHRLREVLRAYNRLVE